MSQEAYFWFLVHLYHRLLQFSGLWPIKLERSNYTFRRCNVLVSYSAIILFLSLNALNIASLTYRHVWPATGCIISEKNRFLGTFGVGSVLLIIFVSQYSQLKKLMQMTAIAFRVLSKVQTLCLDSPKSYLRLLLLFTVKTVGLQLVEACLLVRHLLVIVPQLRNSPMTMLCWLYPSWVVSLLPEVIFGMMLILSYHFRLLNHRMNKIINTSWTTITRCNHNHNKGWSRKPHPKWGIRMQTFCDLSDRLDEIAVLHQELSTLTKLMNRTISIQLLIWTIWMVSLLIIKLFLGYFLVAKTFINHTATFNQDLFFGLLLSLLTTMFSLACSASASSQIMSEVSSVSSKKCHHHLITSPFLCNCNKKAKVWSISFRHN